MSNMENEGDMKHWLRGSVVVGDLLIWISAVVYYARANFGVGKPEKALQTIVRNLNDLSHRPTLIITSNCRRPSQP
jgi:alpha-1,3-glucosyltransferase